MSLDLVAVQRDAALLDALSARFHPVGIESDTRHDADPVVGLLAALVADVDDGLPEVAGRAVAPVRIPEQSRHRARPATVSALPVALAPVRRRHVARAVAAMVVTAAVLSVSGVAAAVSGDPLTPYKIVIDVVRGHGDAVQKSLPEARATQVAGRAHNAAGAGAGAGGSPVADAGAARASRSAHGRNAWNRHAPGRDGWDRGGWGRHDGDSHGWDGRQRHGDNGDNTDRHHRTGSRDGGGSTGDDSGDHTSGPGGGGDGTGRDSGGHDDGSGHDRR